MARPKDFSDPEIKALLKESLKLAAKNTRLTGDGHGVYQRDDDSTEWTVAKLKYGGPNNRFEWNRIAKVTPKSNPSHE